MSCCAVMVLLLLREDRDLLAAKQLPGGSMRAEFSVPVVFRCGRCSKERPAGRLPAPHPTRTSTRNCAHTRIASRVEGHWRPLDCCCGARQPDPLLFLEVGCCSSPFILVPVRCCSWAWCSCLAGFRSCSNSKTSESIFLIKILREVGVVVVLPVKGEVL